MNGFILLGIMVCQSGGWNVGTYGPKCQTNHMAWVRLSEVVSLEPQRYYKCKNTDYESSEKERDLHGPNKFKDCDNYTGYEGCLVTMRDAPSEWSKEPCSKSLKNLVSEDDIMEMGD